MIAFPDQDEPVGRLSAVPVLVLRLRHRLEAASHELYERADELVRSGSSRQHDARRTLKAWYLNHLAGVLEDEARLLRGAARSIESAEQASVEPS